MSIAFGLSSFLVFEKLQIGGVSGGCLGGVRELSGGCPESED